MGKGDKRSRRGKIFAGSYGKTRPKNKKMIVAAPTAPRALSAPVAAPEKPKPKVKKKVEQV